MIWTVENCEKVDNRVSELTFMRGHNLGQEVSVFPSGAEVNPEHMLFV